MLIGWTENQIISHLMFALRDTNWCYLASIMFFRYKPKVVPLPYNFLDLKVWENKNNWKKIPLQRLL